MNRYAEAHKTWQNNFLGSMMPTLGYDRRPVYVTHGKHGIGTAYPATIHHPQNWILEDALEGVQETPRTRTPYSAEHPEAQWVTIRTHPDELPHAVRVHPDGHGRHVISGGVGGRMNGITLEGVLPENAYHTLQRRDIIEQKQQQALATQSQEMTRQILLRQLERGRGVTPVNVHTLPMTEEQENEYATTLHHLGLAEAGLRKNQPDDYAMRRLAAYGDMHGMSMDDMRTRWPALRDGLVQRLVHGHSKGANAEWLKNFAASNQEPIIVQAKNPYAISSAADALRTAGRKVGVATYDNPLANHLFAPQSGVPHLDAVVVQSGLKHPVRRSHLVYYDTKPQSNEVDTSRYHSAHHLNVDTGVS